ncbi:MAG: amidohydrolase family protein [Clostridia bacterium]|nr:amidohydrolase family protein [Clostridia bacterium]
MIIDFHTHIFPDKIARKTVDYLSNLGGIPAHADGTLVDLLAKLDEASVERSVTLPVLTSPKQYDSVLNYAQSVNAHFYAGKHGVLSFAGIHPLCEDLEGKMAQIKALGFKGIKIHPDYQGVYFDDECVKKVLRLAVKHDLIVVTHAGVDVGFKDQPVRCTPDRVLKALEDAPGVKLVLAHYGASEMEDEVFEKLAGLPVYFDTAYILEHIDKEKFIAIADKHGYDKILFATDSPWKNIAKQVEIIRSYGLSKENQDKIFYKNALKLLGE